MYFAGAALKDGKLVTSGGRVVGVASVGDTLEDAVKKAYAASEGITFKGAFKRNDIGAKALHRMSFWGENCIGIQDPC